MKTKKIFIGILTLALMLSLSIPTFAATNDGKITVSNVSENTKLNIYRILSIKELDNGAYIYDFMKSSYRTAFIDAITNGNELFNEKSTVAEILGYITDNKDEFNAENLAAALEKLVGNPEYTQVNGLLDNDKITIDVLLGYYLVIDVTPYEENDRNSVLLMLDTAAPTAEITLKTETYTVPEKEQTTVNLVDDSNNTTVKNGDVVDYTISVDIPNYSTYTKHSFQIVDNMSAGLRFIAESVKISIANKPLDSDKYTMTHSTDATGKTTITFDFGNINETFAGYIGAKIFIQYAATVNVDGFNLGKHEITNDVEVLENDVTIKGDGTTLNSYGITINKVNEYEDALKGVVFQIYSGEKIADVIKDIPKYLYFILNGGIYYYSEEGAVGATNELVTNEEGKIQIFGLDNDTYWLVEKENPLPGYNKLVGSTEVAIENKNGEATVVNKTGIEVPETGGIGTLAFTICGLAMIVGVGTIIVISKKRRSNSNNAA